jgi:aspartyl-tRNA(Asn)/glutamyl-tRNA(Gln) amidotransferase subunit C
MAAVVNLVLTCYHVAMSEITSQDVDRLGGLARLELTAEEIERFAGQLSSVVGYVEQLTALDTSNAKSRNGVTGTSNLLATDMPRQPGDAADVPRADLLTAVPAHRNGLIQVRAVLGE